MKIDDEKKPFWWDDDEAVFVWNMRRLRERQGITQTELARRAKAAGLQFHQPTVQRIESGERPLKLHEATRIARILGSDLKGMMHASTPSTAAQELLESARRVGLAAWNYGMPPVDNLVAILSLIGEAEESHANYLSVCESQNVDPSTELLREFEDDRNLGVQTVKFLTDRARHWELMASNYPEASKFEDEADYWDHLVSELVSVGGTDAVERFAQRSYGSFEGDADVPAENVRGESDA